MNNLFLEKNIQLLMYQRNIFAALTLLIALSLIITSSLLIFKTERIVIVPPVIEKEFWVDSNTISPTYLEQFGSFLGQLLLNKSSNSASNQRTILLRHTDPSYVGDLKQRLIDEETSLKKHNSSYVFFPIEVNVNPQTMEVALVGDRLFYVGSKQVSTEKESYVLSFSYLGGKLFLKGITSKISNG